MSVRENGQAVERRILFIGNSFTQRNQMPQMLVDLAAARRIRITFDLISVGGASLRMHWNRGEATRAIASRGHSLVVLQEQSTLPVKNAQRMAENVRLFDAEIQKAGGRTVLYMTWARQHVFHETQPSIIDAYESIGRELSAMLVPVGIVWRDLLATDTCPELYDRDQSHPSLAGSYLAACVFLATLFQQDPTGGPSPPKIAPEAARTIEAAAKRALVDQPSGTEPPSNH